jgi:tight adherence protein C
MQMLLAMSFAGLSCALLLLIPIALPRRNEPVSERDQAWRDDLPLFLRLVRPLLQWYAPAVDSSLNPQRREVIQSQLNAAGAAYLVSPAEFVILRRMAFIAGIVVAGVAMFVLKLKDPFYLAIAAGLAPLSYLYPDLRLRELTKQRQARFEKEFPFFLDVVVLAMKAGLNFTAAVEQAICAARSGPVQQEFSRYLRESRTGVSRRVALERVAERVLLASVTNFAASVVQAEQTGGSLADVLADQARQRRQERFVRAEKLANQAPVKMLFPLIALLFPITFIIIGFPIVVQLREAGALTLF